MSEQILPRCHNSLSAHSIPSESCWGALSPKPYSYGLRRLKSLKRIFGFFKKQFRDGNSALMLVCARLRHVAGTQWGCKKYMNMKHLEAVMDDASIAG